MDQPRYEHDCRSCLFLGQYQKFDLYFCPKDPTIIARYSSDPSCYHSGIVFAVIADGRAINPYAEALVRTWRMFPEYRKFLLKKFSRDHIFPEREESSQDLIKIAETDPKDYPLLVNDIKRMKSYYGSLFEG